MVEFSYTAGEYEAVGEFSPIPAGMYDAKITSSDVTKNSKGTGDILKLTFEILDGQYKDRKIFENLNIRHDNPKAMQIAQNNLNGILKSTGMTGIKDTDQLIDKKLKIKVTIKTEDRGVNNRIVAYYELGSITPYPSATAGVFKPSNTVEETLPELDDDIPF